MTKQSLDATSGLFVFSIEQFHRIVLWTNFLSCGKDEMGVF